MSTFNEFYCIYARTRFGKQDPSRTKNYGLFYLSDKARKSMNDWIRLYDNGVYMHTGLSGKHLNQHQEAIYEEQIENEEQTENNKEFCAEIKKVVADKEIAEDFETREKFSRILQDETKWKDWKKQLSPENDAFSRFNIRYINWQKHAKFAHYSPEAILMAADVLNELEWHIEAATREYRTRKFLLPTAARKSYGTYLQSFSQRIQAEKTALCWAMLTRLRLATARDRLTDNVLEDMASIIKKCNFKINVPDLKPSSALTGVALNQFLHYLMKHGNTELNTKLKKLPWFKVNRNLSLAVIKNNKQSFMVPATFQSLVPHKNKKPAVLFEGHNLRHSFFQKHADLLMDLARLGNMNVRVKYPDNDPFESCGWSELLQYEMQIEIALWNSEAQVATHQSLFQKMFRKKTTVLLQQWRNTLLEQQKVSYHKQLLFLANNIIAKSQTAEGCLAAPVFKQAIRDKFTEKLIEINRYFQANPYAGYPEIQELLAECSTHLMRDQEREKPYRLRLTIEQNMQRMANNEWLHDEEFQQIIVSDDLLNTAQKKEIRALCRSEIIKISDHLVGYFSRTSDTLMEGTLSFPKCFASMYRFRTLLQQFNFADNRGLLEAIIKCLTEYRKYINADLTSSQVINQHKDELEAFERLLGTFLPDNHLNIYRSIRGQRILKSQIQTTVVLTEISSLSDQEKFIKCLLQKDIDIINQIFSAEKLPDEIRHAIKQVYQIFNVAKDIGDLWTQLSGLTDGLSTSEFAEIFQPLVASIKRLPEQCPGMLDVLKATVSEQSRNIKEQSDKLRKAEQENKQLRAEVAPLDKEAISVPAQVGRNKNNCKKVENVINQAAFKQALRDSVENFLVSMSGKEVPYSIQQTIEAIYKIHDTATDIGDLWTRLSTLAANMPKSEPSSDAINPIKKLLQQLTLPEQTDAVNPMAAPIENLLKKFPLIELLKTTIHEQNEDLNDFREKLLQLEQKNEALRNERALIAKNREEMLRRHNPVEFREFLAMQAEKQSKQVTTLQQDGEIGKVKPKNDTANVFAEWQPKKIEHTKLPFFTNIKLVLTPAKHAANPKKPLECKMQ